MSFFSYNYYEIIYLKGMLGEIMIKNPELLKLVKYKLGVFDASKEISEEDLAKVRELSVRNKSISGKPLDIDLTELTQLTGIEDLDLQLFSVGKREAEAISALKNLRRLTIRDSRVDGTIALDQLENLTIERGRIESSASLPDAASINLIGLEEVDVSRFLSENSKASSLTIRGGKISNLNRLTNLNSLRSVTIEATKADKDTLKDLVNNNVYVKYNEDERTFNTSKIL
jgi:hypothetical protein